MKRAPISVSIQPQMLMYGVILAGVCGMTYYNERKRDPEELEMKIQGKYRGDLQDIQTKNDQMATKIRGQDTKLDGVMNKLVWNGHARIPPKQPITPTMPVAADTSDDESSSSSSSSDSDSMSDSDDGMNNMGGTDEKSERKKKRRERRRRRRERRKKRQEEEAKRQSEVDKLAAAQKNAQLQQNVVAAAAVGAVALAAVTFLSGSRRQ
mmetsp:Transcript_595/g.1440  ORF Transcript_595/g.1440 Transcript_595/m.1440 type:complete len:209 (-) Transcript_595:373-999(-)|eukprot:CAMPEP_0119551550 /NCGR_PEP_ID=MMETSP1352-20130426/4769_1 /TAXON_ID=265584 /ORGANISM="Stauroneis constricta, Strain CCMP1120" /LENGTH=208 /DNA_ID=CAMNT_0007597623 /DNA_START=96 /DNA_END=722 /DNA_ORIENTATION=-